MYSKTVRSICIVALVVAGTAACSSGPAPSVPAPPTSSSPTAEAVNGEVTRKEGAAMYLKLVSPFNEAFEKCLKVYNPLMEAGATSPSDFPKVRSACADIPGENRKFSEGLVKGKWPTEAQSSVSQLADEVRADQLAWQEIAKARVHDDLFDPKYPLTEDTETAGLVRAHLGLPAAEDIEE